MIYLLRHGAVEGHEERRFIGQFDLPLGENGLRQARWWRKELADILFDRIFCSDLTRSRDTARIIAGTRKRPIEVMPQLREIHLGEWEGLSVAEVRRRFPEEYERRGQDLSDYRPPGGESFNDLRKRILPVFERIVSEMEGHILIVGHAGVNRTILCHLLGMPLRNLFRLGQDYGSLNIIECNEGSLRLKTINILPFSSLHANCLTNCVKQF